VITSYVSCKIIPINELNVISVRLPTVNKKINQRKITLTSQRYYKFKSILFDLKDASTMFQKLMDQVLSSLQEKKLFVYLDICLLYMQVSFLSTTLNSMT